MHGLCSRMSCRLAAGAFAGWSLLGQGCSPATGPSPGANARQTEDDFFIGDAATDQSLAIGGQVNLDGGGSIGLPKGSPAEVEMNISKGSLKPDAAQRLAEWNPGISFQGHVFKITVTASDQPPRYLILQLPTSDPTARIFVSGFVDEDTGDQDWAPVPGVYDPQTGLVTAAVGLGRLGLAEQDSATQKGSAALSSAGSTTYTGHVGVGVGGQQFNAQIVFIAEEPTGPLDVPFEGPPIAVRARAGLTLSNITHRPLDSLTVTSDFGPRPQPVQGASTNHQGVDYRAANGTTVYAAGDGTVLTSRCQLNSVNCGRTANGDITGGYIVEIDHGNGETTRYMHMTNPATVNAGDKVTSGQAIGLSDSSGGVTPHLHFEVKKNGTAVDPELIFNATVTATIAMAIDYDVQAGTEQEIPLTRGIIALEDMSQYLNIVELTGVEPGDHKLQFVIVEPSGTLEVLYAVPLKVGEPFMGLTGAELTFQDVARDQGSYFQYETERLESVYSLVAIDGSRLQGQAHITYSRLVEEVIPLSSCPKKSDSYGPVEWDAFLEGTYQVGPDGIYVQFEATPPSGPDYTFTSTNPGCAYLDQSSTLSGITYFDGNSALLVDGRYDYRIDTPLNEGVSGEDYFEIHMRWTDSP